MTNYAPCFVCRCPHRRGVRTELVVWIDTAFNGGLTIPRKQVDELALVQESSAEAILADGRAVELETKTVELK